MTETLAAVIVTYNRAEKLAKVLAALAAQTRAPDVVHVVDNASDDHTAEMLAGWADKRVRHHRLPDNIGGAGGFAEGVRISYEAGADWIWISDDDAYPEPNALEILLDAMTGFAAETGETPGFACSRVLWTDGSLCEMNTPVSVWDWPRWYRAERPLFLVRSCSFVSVLVPRRAVAEHGLPIAEYFIWHDDVEYTRRLARTHPGLFVPDSVVVHDIAENRGANLSLVTEATLWKFRYGVRNEASRIMRDDGVFGYLAFAYEVRSRLRRGRVPFRLRRRIYAALARGAVFRPPVRRV